MNLPPNYAGIDIGSNGIRLLIANVVGNENYTDVKEKLFVRMPLRLGEDVFATGRIGDRKISELTYAVTGFMNIMKAYHVVDYKACATSAMREAENGKEIAETIHRKSGIDIHIINGQQEADIIYSAGVASNICNSPQHIYVDVGGGSTEITVFYEHKKVDSQSFKLGTVRMLSQHENAGIFSDLKDWLNRITDIYRPKAIIGTGGNINKAQKLINKRIKEPLLYNELKKMYNKINDQSLEERIAKMRLKEDRADVIVPALQIFLTVMNITGIDNVFVPRVGLADGIVRKLYSEKFM